MKQQPTPDDQKIAQARQRFGRPFCHEKGTTWRPRQKPLLTEWLAQRMAQKQKAA